MHDYYTLSHTVIQCEMIVIAGMAGSLKAISFNAFIFRLIICILKHL